MDDSTSKLRITEKDLESALTDARLLASEDKHAEALENYLFFYDNSVGIRGFGGVRLSYVPEEIIELSTHYPPAREALVSRRDDCERAIFDGTGGSNEVHEVYTPNNYLGVNERSLELYDRVKEMGSEHAELRDDLLRSIWRDLVFHKRYGELSDIVADKALQIAKHVAEYQVEVDFRTMDVKFGMAGFYAHTIMNDGPPVFEVLLGIGNDELAARLSKWLLLFQNGALRKDLIESAGRAGRSDFEVGT